MREHEIQIQSHLLNMAIFERKQKQRPIQWISGAGLELADKRLPSPFVRIPKGSLAAMPGDGLKLQPRHHLISHIRLIHPCVLFGKQLPEEAGDDEGEDQRAKKPAHKIMASARSR